MAPIEPIPTTSTTTAPSRLPISTQLATRARRAGSNRSVKSLATIDPVNDAIWAKTAEESIRPSSYYDYFFTGQDMVCYIEGVRGALDIMEFAFNVQQQKVPVYGFWSYTHDNVMRGVRTVTGAFRVATVATDYMANRIADAAAYRANADGGYVLRGLDMDEKNIEKYWERNVDPSNAYSYSRNVFSVHPPFNFVCIYGLQSSSITSDPRGRLEEVRNKYRMSDTPMMTDINERLVATNQDNAMRYVIENVELTGLQVEYAPTGEVCSEVYSFFAREYLPAKDITNRKHY